MTGPDRPTPAALAGRGRAAMCVLALLLAGCVAARPSPPVESDRPGWTLIFADEFDKAGPPDPAKWTPELGYVRNEEAQYYTARPENLRVEGGRLVIEARREPYQGRSYTSASISTVDRLQFWYGRVEVRAKLPGGRGTWPAAWLLGANIQTVGWPASGEIDIMENVGHEPHRIYGTVHTPAYNHTLANSKGGTIDLDSPWMEWHVYGLDWSKERIEFLIDGRSYYVFRNDGTGSAAWPFDKPFYLILNLAIGGAWGGERGIDEAAFPQAYLIDYVRIYQRRDLARSRTEL